MIVNMIVIMIISLYNNVCYFFGLELRQLSAKGREQIEKLRQRPRTRPDWSAIMKGVNDGVKLRKTETNDRSCPVLPKGAKKGKNVSPENEKKSNF